MHNPQVLSKEELKRLLRNNAVSPEIIEENYGSSVLTELLSSLQLEAAQYHGT